MKRVKFDIKRKSHNSWREVLDNPCSIHLESIETGRAEVSLVGLLDLKCENANGIENEFVEIKFYSHLIYHEKLGYFLIDTGIDSSYQRNPFGTLKGALIRKYTVSYRQKKGQNVASRLKEKGVELSGVFLTHLHFDHIAGIIDLPKDIDYVAGKGEKYQNYKFLFYGNHLKGVKLLYEMDFSNESEMSPLGPAIDVFGDGSLWAVSTPGHTKGHISYLVNSNKGAAVIAGDACMVRKSIDMCIGPGRSSMDVLKARESFNNLGDFIIKYPEVRLICGHEL